MASLKSNHDDIDLYKDVEKIKAALRIAAEDVKGKAGEILSESMGSIKKESAVLKDTVEDYTAKKPLKSLGIALLVGVAIGYLIHK